LLGVKKTFGLPDVPICTSYLGDFIYLCISKKEYLLIDQTKDFTPKVMSVPYP